MFTIIVVSEGAVELGGTVTVNKVVKDSPDPIRLGGIANKLTYQLEQLIGDEHEIRPVVLGHTQRGGAPDAQDRIFATQCGVEAARACLEGQFGFMVAQRAGKMVRVPLEDVAGKLKYVDPDSDLVREAKLLGISFGDE